MPATRRRTIGTALAAVLSATAAAAQPVVTIWDYGSPSNRVDIVVLGDGYTAEEIGKFATDVDAMVAGMFSQAPYSEYYRFFNVHRIDVTSAESGADHPSRGIYRDTAFGSAYDCGGIQRLICADVSAVNDVVARSIADPNARDFIILLVNDPEYGGSGGTIAVAYSYGAVVDMVLHEFGHSFALLADEYAGPPPPSCSLYEPSSPNVTMQTDRNAIKWKPWIEETTPIPTTQPLSGVPGLYEGAQYCDTAKFRPTWNSKMRSLGAPFEQINVEAHVKRIYNRVSPIDAVTPGGGSLQARPGETISFGVSVPAPATHGLDIAWSVDGSHAGSAPLFGFGASDFSPGSHTVVVTVTDPTSLVRSDPAGVLQESESWTVWVVDWSPFGGTPRTVPGTVEAEDFDEGGEGIAYHDTTTGNEGDAYRDTNVDLQDTTDTGGGYNVGWMRAGEWLQYTVSVTQDGTYTLTARVAANGAGGTFHVEFDGEDKTGPLTIPATGGWQAWTDVGATVTLTAGVQQMRVVADSSGPTGVFGNLNHVRIAASGGSEWTPFGGAPRVVPGTVEAEHFDEGGEGIAYHDTTTGNAGGAYRETDVDLEDTADTGGGYNVGWMRAGEWLHYTVDVQKSGTYTLVARVAANGAGGTFHVEFGGQDKTGPLTIPATGDWQSWTDVSADVTLTAGVQQMRVVADSSGPTGVFGNLNHVRIAATGGSESTPFGGTPRAVPGTIQAEHFDEGGEGIAYHDTTTENAGGAYRDTGVDLEDTADTGGGYNVGWMRAGEWLQYTVAVQEGGTYTLVARVAANGAGGTFHVEFDGADMTGPLTIPATGDWQSWTDVSATLMLSAGVQTMRVVAESSGPTGVFGNVNHLTLHRAIPTPRVP